MKIIFETDSVKAKQISMLKMSTSKIELLEMKWLKL